MPDFSDDRAKTHLAASQSFNPSFNPCCNPCCNPCGVPIPTPFMFQPMMTFGDPMATPSMDPQGMSFGGFGGFGGQHIFHHHFHHHMFHPPFGFGPRPF